MESQRSHLWAAFSHEVYEEELGLTFWPDNTNTTLRLIFPSDFFQQLLNTNANAKTTDTVPSSRIFLHKALFHSRFEVSCQDPPV